MEHNNQEPPFSRLTCLVQCRTTAMQSDLAKATLFCPTFLQLGHKQGAQTRGSKNMLNPYPTITQLK